MSATPPVLPITDEPEILAGTRAFDTAQALLRGQVDTSRASVDAVVGWYGNDVSPYEGSFAMVAAGGALTDLIGDVLRVQYNDRVVYAYCVGGATLPNDLCLARSAFIRLAVLSAEEIPVSVRVVA